MTIAYPCSKCDEFEFLSWNNFGGGQLPFGVFLWDKIPPETQAKMSEPDWEDPVCTSCRLEEVDPELLKSIREDYAKLDKSMEPQIRIR